MRLPAPVTIRTADWVLQFVNIVFLLLLYFLVRGSVYERQQPGIEPPVTVLAPAAPPPPDALYIARDGALTWHGEALSLESAAAAIAAGPSRLQVTIVADRALPASHLTAVAAALKVRGIEGVALMTEQEARK